MVKFFGKSQFSWESNPDDPKCLIHFRKIQPIVRRNASKSPAKKSFSPLLRCGWTNVFRLRFTFSSKCRASVTSSCNHFNNVVYRTWRMTQTVTNGARSMLRQYCEATTIRWFVISLSLINSNYFTNSYEIFKESNSTKIDLNGWKYRAIHWKVVHQKWKIYGVTCEWFQQVKFTCPKYRLNVRLDIFTRSVLPKYYVFIHDA